MSTENITSKRVVGSWQGYPIVLIAFELRNGDEKTFRFTGQDAVDVLNGEDPARLNGTEV
jgi:hypothetical protein